MDITKFNKELKTRVSLARSYERRNEIDSAIKLWLEISEMALKFSKSRNIDARYKNMLLNRTKGIIEHIKSLKAGQYEKALFEDESIKQTEEVRDHWPPDRLQLRRLFGFLLPPGRYRRRSGRDPQVRRCQQEIHRHHHRESPCRHARERGRAGRRGLAGRRRLR